MIAASRSLYRDRYARASALLIQPHFQGVSSMPISIQVSRGLLTSKGEREVFPLIAEALLKAHGLVGNSFMTANVIGHLGVIA
jgi:hypothetical protein